MRRFPLFAIVVVVIVAIAVGPSLELVTKQWLASSRPHDIEPRRKARLEEQLGPGVRLEVRQKVGPESAEVRASKRAVLARRNQSS